MELKAVSDLDGFKKGWEGVRPESVKNRLFSKC